jgi:hypothetical protein
MTSIRDTMYSMAALQMGNGPVPAHGPQCMLVTGPHTRLRGSTRTTWHPCSVAWAYRDHAGHQQEETHTAAPDHVTAVWQRIEAWQQEKERCAQAVGIDPALSAGGPTSQTKRSRAVLRSWSTHPRCLSSSGNPYEKEWSSMSILVHPVEPITWLWHDATICFFHTGYEEDGEITVCLRCRIHPDEDRQSLIDLNINTEIVDVLFRDVLQFRTMIHGSYSSNVTIDGWSVVHPSPIIDHMHAVHEGSATGLVHYRLTHSTGSSMDIVCGAVWLAEVTA